MRTVIKVENLSKKFRIGRLRSDDGTLRDVFGNLIKRTFNRGDGQETENLWALRDVSFEVKQGETFGIVGGNGAGKSTLLKILSRIIKPTAGRAKLNGRVGSLLEIGTGFHQDLTGRENIFLNGAVLGMRHREVEKKFDEIVAFADLEKFLDTPVKFYSTGMYARLAFAVAAHLEPEILIVDEVLAVGDAAFQAKCLGKMGEVAASGRTVLFVSHAAESVVKLCRSGLYLEKGKVKKLGEINAVMAQYKADYERDLFSKQKISREAEDVKFGQCRFLKWKILNPKSKNPSEIITREKATFEFEFLSLRHSDTIKFDFLIRDEYNRIVVSAQYQAEIEEGLSRLRWTCELPLRAGSYLVTVRAESVSEEIVLDAWDCDPRLNILPDYTAYASDIYESIVSVNNQISVERE